MSCWSGETSPALRDGKRMSTTLDQIAGKARSAPKLRFTSLAHLLTPAFLNTLKPRPPSDRRPSAEDVRASHMSRVCKRRPSIRAAFFSLLEPRMTWPLPRTHEKSMSIWRLARCRWHHLTLSMSRQMGGGARLEQKQYFIPFAIMICCISLMRESSSKPAYSERIER